MENKTYIGIDATFDMCGRITPVCILWNDGRRFPVDKVLDIRPAASLKSGGCGIRYTCRVKNREIFLFLEENRWFVERK